ncbi:MAG TPA: hypothetical protein DCY79_16610 [Planctomycetaceae bacterium]|nr:hypothetical protein [Blastopirellula sp.]HAY81427.1 hypothetical protein [Planctomycetaceae bacterium]
MKRHRLAVDSSRPGFTLVELLVVIAIIGVLVALLLPAVQMAREAARKMQCSSQLHNLVLAMQQYEGRYEAYPNNGGYSSVARSKNGLVGNDASKGSVFVKLLPFIEQEALYDTLDFRVAGSTGTWLPRFEAQSFAGKRAGEFMLDILQCPTAESSGRIVTKGGVNIAPTNYGVCWGYQPINETFGNTTQCDNCNATNPNFLVNAFRTNITVAQQYSVNPKDVSGMFSRYDFASRHADCKDGTSHTIMLGEIRPECCPDVTELGWMNWAATVIPTTGGINFVGQEPAPFYGTPNACTPATSWVTAISFRSQHSGGAQFSFVDGSTKFIAETIDYQVFQQLGDRRDAIPIDDSAF